MNLTNVSSSHVFSCVFNLYHHYKVSIYSKGSRMFAWMKLIREAMRPVASFTNMVYINVIPSMDK